MSCSPFDLKDYFLGELRPEDRAAVEHHVADCFGCREELQSLNLTRAALLSLSDEEPPRRIAFVSDKVFEPSWWQKLWRSGSQLGFASAAMLSLALIVHAFAPSAITHAPAPAAAANQTLTPAAVEAMIQAEVAKRLDAAVLKAVEQREEQQTAKLVDLVNTRLKRNDREYQDILLAVKEYVERIDKRQALLRRAAYDGVMQ